MSENIRLNGGGSLSSNLTRSTSFDIVVKQSLPLDKSFSECTDAEIALIAKALQDGSISTDDLPWAVGDTRSVNLNSFKAFYSSGSTFTEAAQIAQLVIMQKKNTGKQFIDGSSVNFIIGFKNCVCKSVWGPNNTYASSYLKAVEDNIYNALPIELKFAFKEFKAKTMSMGKSGTLTEYSVYMCSPAEKEVFGDKHSSATEEADALIQFDYFKSDNNKLKEYEGSNCRWWERSPYVIGNGSELACRVSDGGVILYGSDYTYISFGISPFGCI